MIRIARFARPQARVLPAVLLAAVLLAGCGSSSSSSTTAPAPRYGTATGSAAPTAKIPGAAEVRAEFAGIPQHGEVAGDPKAPWTLVEYGDLQCPACKFAALTTLPDVVKQLVRTGKIRLAMRLFGYVGPDSKPAANYAWAAARQNRLHEFTRLWYANQGQENSGYVTDAFAKRIAAGVGGLDAARVVSDAKSVPVRALQQRTSDEFKRLALQGTPSFLIGRTGSSKLSPIDLGDGTGAAAVAAIQAAIS